MSEKKPIQIQAELKTPVEVGRFPIALDGLVFHALCLSCGDSEKAAQMLGSIFDYQGDVACASSMLFTVRTDQRVTAHRMRTVGVMRQESDLAKHWYHPDGKKGKYNRIEQRGGPKGNRLPEHKTHYADGVSWFARADPKAVVDLLNFFVSNIGLNARIGFGSVGTFRASEIDEDRSLIHNDASPARVLPCDLFEQLGGDTAKARYEMAQVAPPYTGEKQIQCACPQRIQRI